MEKILSELEKRFTSDIWQRGKRYYEEGLIDKIVKSGDVITAVSYGNSAYRLKINLKSKEMSCSCPCDFECKHLAALIIWLRNNKAVDLADMAGSLEPKTKEELIAMLCNILRNKPELMVYTQVLNNAAISDLIKKTWFPKNGDNATMYSQLDYVKEAIFNKRDWELAIALLRKLIDLYDHDPESDELINYIDTLLYEVSKQKLAKQQKEEIRQIIKEYPFDF